MDSNKREITLRQGDLRKEMKRWKQGCANITKRTIKNFLAIIMRNGGKCKLMEVITAYLRREEIKRTMYLKSREVKCQGLWRLRTIVYGLKDAVRTWYNTTVKILEKMGGRICRLEPTLFKRKKKYGEDF